MRYVVLAALGVLGVILNGSFFSALPTGGLQVDVALALSIALALRDKSSAPIIFAAASGLLLDLLYSPVLGVGAMSFTIVTALTMFLSRDKKKRNPLWVFAYGAGGYALKGVATILILAAMGFRLQFGQLFAGSVLPSAVLAGLVTYLPWMLFGALYKKNWMRPDPSHGMDKFDF